MKQRIEHFYKNILNIKNKETLEFLVNNSTLVKIKKRTTLFKAGEAIDKLYFFFTGFYYGYLLKTPSRKVISCISHMPGLPLIPTTEVKEQIAIHEVYIPVDSEFICTDFSIIAQAIQKYPDANESYVNLLKACYNHQMSIQELRAIPSIKRVQRFFEEYAHCAPSMTNTEIAAFLDMSRAEFSKAFKQAQLSHKEE